MEHASLVALVPALLIASFFDVAERRVPNALVGILLAGGVLVSLFYDGPTAALSAIGLVILGLTIWIPFYALRMLGAGDVKLFAASSAWLVTASQVLVAAAASAIIGGMLAIAWALLQGRVLTSFGNTVTMVRFRMRISFDRKHQKLPYGVAMAIGILWSFTRV